MKTVVNNLKALEEDMCGKMVSKDDPPHMLLKWCCEGCDTEYVFKVMWVRSQSSPFLRKWFTTDYSRKELAMIKSNYVWVVDEREIL
jgi:hypothetical protein